MAEYCGLCGECGHVTEPRRNPRQVIADMVEHCIDARLQSLNRVVRRTLDKSVWSWVHRERHPSIGDIQWKLIDHTGESVVVDKAVYERFAVRPA